MYFYIVFLAFIQLSMSQNQTTCSLLKDKLANHTSEFTFCALNNSRPVTLCGQCIPYYLNVLQTYRNMTTELVDNSTRCIDQYINLDRLQILNTLYTNSFNLWSNAKCDECFQINNGTWTSTKSTKAQKFQNYSDSLQACIKEYNDSDKKLCPSCMKDYTNLDEYYIEISNENEKIATCMDMVDLMNSTRSFWSQHCCKYRRHNEFIFLVSSIFVSIATLCFYVAVQFCAVKKSPTILQQSRFAVSFHQNSHSEG